MEKVNVKTEEIKEDVGDVKHRLDRIEFMFSMSLKRQRENPEECVTGEKKRKLNLDVDAISTAWDEERTTSNLDDKMQAITKRADKDHYDDNKGFVIEKVENKCIHLELSASPDVFGSPQKLRIAIKSLIRQFVIAGELDGNVPATVNINITVNSALTTKEKNVVYTVFSENDTLDGSDYDEKLQIEQKPRLNDKVPTVEPDQQIASTSAKRISVHLEKNKFNLQIKGLPHSLSNSMDKEHNMNIEESVDFSVIWTWHYTQKKHSWDVVSIADTINSKIQHLRDWFHVEYAKIDISGRLALQTTTASHTFSSLSSLEMAVKSFLEKFIEVCDFEKYIEEEQMIKLDVTCQLNEDNDDNPEIRREEMEKPVDTILTCDDCKKDLICLVCKTSKSLISRLNDKLQEQRNTIMRLQRRMSTFGEWNEGFADDVFSSDDETEDLDFERISVHLEKNKFNLQIKGLPHSLSNSMDKEHNMNIEESVDFSVIWTWHYTQKKHSWDVVSIADTINSKIQHLRDWFHVEYAKIDISGRLALQTTTASHTFSSLSSLEMAVKSFLEKFIEVCDFEKYIEEEQMIKLDVTCQLNEDNDDNPEIRREEMEKPVDTILTCDDCKKDLICLVCKTSKSLISRLNDKLQEQRNTIMRLQRRMSTFGEWNEGFADDVFSSDDETEDLDFERISVHLEKNKFNLQIKGLPHSLSNSMDKEHNMNIEESVDFSVIWTWHYTQKKHSWDVVSIADTINSKIQHLRDWFHVEYAKIDISGRLALQTTTASHTFSSLSSLEMAVKSFLEKFIEVCDFEKYIEEEQMIKLDVTCQLNEDNDDNPEIRREEMEKPVDTILTCDDCKKDLICLVCKTSKSLISRLNDKLQEQRNTIMRLQRRMSTFGEWNEGFADDVFSSDDETEDLDFERISVHLEKNKFNLQIKGLPHSLSNSMDKEHNMNIEESVDFSVIWTWHYTQKKHSWDVVSIADTINSKIQHLRDWFHVEYAKIDISGRLALQTTTASHTFSSLSSLEMAVKSFLEKFIEVCDFEKYIEEEQMIKLDVTCQLNEDNDDNPEIRREEMEKPVDTILTCDDCKKDLICLVCKTSKSLISRLNDKLQEQRNTIMRLQRRMSTFGEWNEGFADDVFSSDDETEDLDFDNSVIRKRKSRTEMSTELLDKDQAAKALKKLKMSTEVETEKELTNTESVKELQDYVINKEKALQKLGEIYLLDMKIKEVQREKKRQTENKRHEYDMTLPTTTMFLEFMPDCLISDFKRQRKERSAIIGALAKIVTTNRNKVVPQEDKRYLEDLGTYCLYIFNNFTAYFKCWIVEEITSHTA
ncbi:uncharacterized protein LOC127732830 [Mytilus californianus]|uniref:uncharacterized protein LOC127732830 n=1 Tax=Mytilus californianus TaxID=6549 RepID=UPI0022465C02|nr:uncharacterized protein LOC127732830 [Mytilus californianus]